MSLHYCEAKLPSGHIKTTTLSASSFSDARLQFMRTTPGVKFEAVSVVEFKSLESFKNKDKKKFF